METGLSKADKENAYLPKKLKPIKTDLENRLKLASKSAGWDLIKQVCLISFSVEKALILSTEAKRSNANIEPALPSGGPASGRAQKKHQQFKRLHHHGTFIDPL